METDFFFFFYPQGAINNKGTMVMSLFSFLSKVHFGQQATLKLF